MPNYTLVGFDFGIKHIGVAVGQTVTQSANPLTALKAENGIPQWDVVDAIIKEWGPKALLVGIPLNMDNSEQLITKQANKFANRLADRYHLPVHRVDERLTTVEARQQLFEQGGYRALTKAQIDSYSAKLIIESWFRDHP
ncbi:MAG: Holliday junction resolvase RuvX [Pseudomonadota bacterium]|nr:Holliday junction resolvase RuvX [Pseudomonadota bacterium]